MLVTVDDAVQRWCPHARQLDIHQSPSATSKLVISGYNRVDGGNIPSCIASSCMAWRFYDPPLVRDIDLVTSDVVEVKPRRGYCGLSGKPIQEE